MFDAEGRQLGVLVRGSDVGREAQYLRAVRMSYVTRRIDAAFGALSPGDQEAVAPYLEP